jgi:LysM repeat protein
LLVLVSALAIAALVLFFLPDLLGIFGGGQAQPTPTPTAAVATPTPEPTPVPAPTPQVYVIKQGDTLSKIARAFGLTLDELLAANSDTIKDPDRIAVGDQIIIPVPVPEEVSGGASESPAP